VVSPIRARFEMWSDAADTTDEEEVVVVVVLEEDDPEEEEEEEVADGEEVRFLCEVLTSPSSSQRLFGMTRAVNETEKKKKKKKILQRGGEREKH